MAKEKFSRIKPHCKIGTIDRVGHGETSLTALLQGVAKLTMAGNELVWEG
jgi:translation elongation factor EF-Tu-like GTPase